MTALKEIRKVICACKYRERQMGKALSQKGFYDKRTLDQRGSRKYQVPKARNDSSFYHPPFNYQVRFIPS